MTIGLFAKTSLFSSPTLASFNRARLVMTIAMFCVLGVTLGGCNTSNSALMDANRALTDRNTALTQENESLKNLVGQLQGAVSARDKALSEQTMLINDLRSGKSGLEGQLASLDQRLKGMNFGNISMLDPSTDSALQDLARQHSDILEYDAARGLLRFKSDVTFDSGSDVVRSGAKSTLSQLAGILNSAAAVYDCRVVGHTDSQRLNPSTRQKHTTNLRLSADRAISVRNELVSAGVNAQRFEIAGRGEFDPLVPNSSNGNTPQNRRVEIYLAKPAGSKIGVSSGNDSGNDASPSPEAVRPGTKAAEEIMK